MAEAQLAQNNVVVLGSGKSTTIALLSKPLTPEAVFVQAGGADAVLAAIEAEVRAFTADISTKDGRSAVASIAHKVARSKTALDDMGKELVSDWKSQSTIVDRERKRLRDRLDEIKDEVRRPLTEWENAETDRVAAHESAIAEMTGISRFEQEPSPRHVAERIECLGTIYARDWQEFAARAKDVHAAEAASLNGKLAERQKAAADAAELLRLREEHAARDQKEREERIAAQAAAKARQEAEEKAASVERERLAAEQRRIQAEQAERERIEQDRARQDRERIAAEERAAKAEADARAAEERREREAKEAEERERQADARRERERQEDEARARVLADQAAQAERQKIQREKDAADAAQRKREADKQHRAKVNREIVSGMIAALADCEAFSEDVAKTIVIAIATGKVPHLTISY